MTRDDLNLKKIKEKLLILKEEAQKFLQIAQKDAKPVILDQSSIGRLSRMDAIQKQEIAKETLRRRYSEIKKIDAALKRIEEGEYGYCIKTGEKIDKKKLQIDPATPYATTKKI